MITIIHGEFGSGKTAILREKLYQDLDSGIECFYSGFNLSTEIFNIKVEEDIPKRFCKFNNKLIRLRENTEVLKQFEAIYDYCQDREFNLDLIRPTQLEDQITFYFDETYWLFDAREHMNSYNRKILYFIAYLSMRGVNFYITTHRLKLF